MERTCETCTATWEFDECFGVCKGCYCEVCESCWHESRATGDIFCDHCSGEGDDDV